MRALFVQQLDTQRQQRAAMEETTNGLRQELLRTGADPGVLRHYELQMIDLALMDAPERMKKSALRRCRKGTRRHKCPHESCAPTFETSMRRSRSPTAPLRSVNG
jgi:hypothetical protein